jgi:hypothetical protein
VPNVIAQNPYIHHYTTLDGLPSNNVYQIFQDSQKFIWFSTDAGVVQFDGTNFKCFRKKDGLSSNDVIRIKEDSFGRIWFFNYNSSVNYYYRGKIFNKENTPFLKSLLGKGFFIDFYVDLNKTIYFYDWQREVFALDTNNNVSKRNRFFNSAITPPLVWTTRESVRISYAEMMANSDLRIFTSYGIYSQKNFNSPSITLDSTLRIFGVFPTKTNFYYLITANKGILKSSKDLKYNKVNTQVAPLKVKSILEDQEGFLWITTLDEGVLCYKNDKLIRRFDIVGALGIFQDHENNIWISSQSDGVYLINHDILTQTHIDNSSFDQLGVENISSNINNGVWCSNGHSVFSVKQKRVSKIQLNESNNLINYILQLKNRKFIVAEKASHIITLEYLITNNLTQEAHFLKSKSYPLYAKGFILNKSGDSIAIYDQNRILLGNIIEMFDNSHQICLTDRINFAYFNENNEIIINGKAIYRLRNGILKPYDELKKFDGTMILDHIIIDSTSEIFNIDGDSLFLRSKKVFFNLTSAFNIIIDSQIKKILYYKSKLYFNTLSNIYICEFPLNLLKRKPVIVRSLNLRFNNIRDFLIKNDSLYIASQDGLTIISENVDNRNKSIPPIPYLLNVSINDKMEILPLNVLTLVGKNTIRLVSSCISYSPSPIIYSYLLEGSDNEWTTGIGSNITVIYQNLHKGNYVFKLRMRKSNSDWSQPLILKITIKPTFWEYPIVRVLIVLLFVSIIVLIAIRIKNEKIKKVEINHQLIVMEQKALQSMMNPHFIFNSLGSIQNYLLKNKAGEAIMYLSQFSRLIRQNLHAINQNMIPLDEEINRLNNYLELEQLRLENKFHYSIEVEDLLLNDNIVIPSMIIQPFAENSIWHGIARIETKGYIKVKISYFSENMLKIMLEDNGVGMDHSKDLSYKSKNHLHLGMQMTRKRLVLLSKKHHIDAHVEFNDVSPGAENRGTRIELFIPYGYGNASI